MADFGKDSIGSKSDSNYEMKIERKEGQVPQKPKGRARIFA